MKRKLLVLIASVSVMFARAQIRFVRNGLIGQTRAK